MKYESMREFREKADDGDHETVSSAKRQRESHALLERYSHDWLSTRAPTCGRGWDRVRFLSTSG